MIWGARDVLMCWMGIAQCGVGGLVDQYPYLGSCGPPTETTHMHKDHDFRIPMEVMVFAHAHMHD